MTGWTKSSLSAPASNQTVLDELSSSGGNLVFNGNPVGSTSTLNIKDDIRDLITNPLRRCNIALIGDSITYGIGASAVVTPNSWATLFTNHVTNKYFKSHNVSAVDKKYFTVIGDLIEGDGQGTSGTPFTEHLVVPSNLTALPGTPPGIQFTMYGDSFQFWYCQSNQSGTFTVNVDGANFTTINAYNATSGTVTVSSTVSGMGASNHTIKITLSALNPGGGSTYVGIGGITITKTGKVDNRGVSGAAVSALYNSVTINPDDDLLFVQYGTNDRGNARTMTNEMLIKGLDKIESIVGHKRIILTSPNPLAVSEEEASGKLFYPEDIDDDYAHHANQRGYLFISHHQDFLDYCLYANVTVDSLLADGIHPLDPGHDLYFRGILRGLGIGRRRVGRTVY